MSMTLAEAVDARNKLVETIAEVIDNGLPDAVRLYAETNGYDFFETLSSDIAAWLITTGWVNDASVESRGSVGNDD